MPEPPDTASDRRVTRRPGGPTRTPAAWRSRSIGCTAARSMACSTSRTRGCSPCATGSRHGGARLSAPGAAAGVRRRAGRGAPPVRHACSSSTTITSMARSAARSSGWARTICCSWSHRSAWSPLSPPKRLLERALGDPESGTHERAPDGFLLALGAAVRPGRLRRGSVLDVVPTVLYFFGLPIGRDMDGYARTDVFTRAFTADTADRVHSQLRRAVG